MNGRATGAEELEFRDFAINRIAHRRSSICSPNALHRYRETEDCL